MEAEENPIMKRIVLALLIIQSVWIETLSADPATVLKIDQVIKFPELHIKHHRSIGKGQLKDIAFGGDNILWMIDSRFLWRWNFLTGSLKKIDLSKDLKIPLHSIERINDELVLFAEKAFYSINIKTLKIRRVVNPSDKKMGPVYVSGRFLFWSDQSSAWKFSMEDRSLTRLSALSGVRKNDIVYHSPSTSNTFIARQNFVILSRKNQEKTEQKIIQKLNKNIDQLFVDLEENIFFISSDVVLRLSPAGKVIQAIPSVGQSIGIADLSNTYHSYFLGKRQALEIYNLKKESRSQLSIPLTTLDVIKVRSKFIAVLSGGKPEVYFVEDL